MPALKGRNFASHGYLYNPRRFIGYLSFACNYYFGGVDVTGYHAVNLAVHILNGLLVYFLVVLTFVTPYFRRLRTGDQAPRTPVQVTDPESQFPKFVAIFSALLFVSHPLQTQAVTYIVQRFASLATLFYLLSLVMYIKGRLEAGGMRMEASDISVKTSDLFSASGLKPLTFFFLSLISAVLAMTTKEIAFTLPLVIILYESIFFTAPLKRKLLFFLPVALTLVIVLLSVMQSGKPLGEILSDISERTRVETQMPRWDYLTTEMRVVTTYIRLLFLPIHQNLDYDYPIYHSLFTPPVFLSFLFLSALLATAI